MILVYSQTWLKRQILDVEPLVEEIPEFDGAPHRGKRIQSPFFTPYDSMMRRTRAMSSLFRPLKTLEIMLTYLNTASKRQNTDVLPLVKKCQEFDGAPHRENGQNPPFFSVFRPFECLPETRFR